MPKTMRLRTGRKDHPLNGRKARFVKKGTANGKVIAKARFVKKRKTKPKKRIIKLKHLAKMFGINLKG